MKYQKWGRWILAETAAMGWFLLRRIPFTGIFLLIPFGLLFYFLPLPRRGVCWLSAGFGILAALISARVTALGFSDSGGWISLFFLMLGAAVFAPLIAEGEWLRIAHWWGVAFIAFFSMLLLGALPGLKQINTIPEVQSGWDLLIFLLLALGEPFSAGKDAKPAPLILCLMLVPFSLISYSVLGERGFQLLEYPYLSVWSGATVISFYHLEGIILSLYFGLAILKLAYAAGQIRKELAIKKKA